MNRSIFLFFISLAIYLEVPAQVFTELDLNSQTNLETDAKIYFSGETHGVSINPELQLHFIKSLYHNNGVRKILFELPLSYTYGLNLFLENGDTNLLKIHAL